MKLIKQKSEFGTIIYLKERGRYLGFSYAGNLDLYLTINGKVDKQITITKENYNLYKAFETLYSDIENINIFDYVESEDIYEYNKMVEEFRERCRKNNQYNYNELFDKKRRTITWYSDETAKEAANYVTLKKQKDAFVLRFYTQSPKTDYNPATHGITVGDADASASGAESVAVGQSADASGEKTVSIGSRQPLRSTRGS